jgi:hypothetical protein
MVMDSEFCGSTREWLEQRGLNIEKITDQDIEGLIDEIKKEQIQEVDCQVVTE